MLVDAVVADPRFTDFAFVHASAGATMHCFASEAFNAAVLGVGLSTILAEPLFADFAAVKLVFVVDPFTVNALMRRPVKIPQHVAQVADDSGLIARRSQRHFYYIKMNVYLYLMRLN